MTKSQIITASKQQEDKTVHDRSYSGRKNSATTTTMSSPLSLTIRQLEDVRDAIRQPLNNRSILIPLGSKAFLEGRLIPTITTAPASSSYSHPPNDNGQERVLVRSAKIPGNETTSTNNTTIIEQEMSRQDALEALSKEIQTLKLANTKKQVPFKSSSSSLSTSSTVAAAAKSKHPQYFEIREEINEVGHEIQSQVVDISNQLQLLETTTTTNRQPDPSEEQKTTSDNRIIIQPDSGDDDYSIDHLQVDEQRLRTLSDPEYDALSARLEELARLEEQQDDGAVENNSHITGIRRDILSNSKTIPKSRNFGWSKGFLNKPSKSQKNNRTNIPISHPTEEPFQERKKTIVFGKNEIREIPPEGNQRSTAEARPRHAHTKPMDPNVFSGVVHEHRKSHGRYKQQGMTETQGTQQPQRQQGKRLSKFAQERQMGLR
jgi:hypothetical protein